MGIEGGQMSIGVAQRGESVVAAAAGDNGAEDFGDHEGRRHGPTGDTAPSNAALVDATRVVLASLGLVVATADRLREDWRHVLEQ
jgi:uncharacterized protein (DUF849 family)